MRICIDCRNPLGQGSNKTGRCWQCYVNHQKKYAKKSYCIDCDKETVRGAKHCKSCEMIRIKKVYFCYDCKKTVRNKNVKRCWECHKKRIYKVKNKCVDCEKELSLRNCTRCVKCNGIFHAKNITGKKHTEEHKKKIGKASKKRWAEENFRNKILKAQRAGMFIAPNRPETNLNSLLNILFSQEYKFVGDGKVIIDGFNPDFINCNGQKKIIELYGDYWHNLPGYKERDIRRLKSYKKYGYQTLIIWEHELKNLNRIKEKIKNFHYDFKF